MTLCVIIRRLNQLRHVEHTMRAALARGHGVVIEVPDSHPGGSKESERATVERIPLRYHKLGEVVRRIHEEPDAILVPSALDLRHIIHGPAVIAALQTTYSDMVYLHTEKFDVVYSWSPYWRSWNKGNPENVVTVGLPAEDVLLDLWGRPPLIDGPYILYYPFPFLGRSEHPLYRWSPFGDLSTVIAARQLADRKGAKLVVKARRKTILPLHTRKLADHIFYDEPGEAIGLHLMAHAKGFIHHCSSGAVEAVAAGIPAINVAPTWWDEYSDRGRAFSPTGPESFYVWPGISTLWRRGPMVLPPFIPANSDDYRTVYAQKAFAGVGTRIIMDLEERVERMSTQAK